MHFLDFLQVYLNENKEIYTVRRFLYEPDNKMVFIPGVGACRRTLVGALLNNSEDAEELLTIYAPKSGLGTFEAWWNKIQMINRKHPTPSLYLYKIVKVR